MKVSAVEKETPRGLIQALLSTSSVSRSVRVTRASSRNRTPATVTDLSKRTRSSTKRKAVQDGMEVATPLEDATPRTLIGKVLDAQSTSKSAVANKRRKTPAHGLAEPLPSFSATSAAAKKKDLLKTPSENTTPRTVIRSILQTAAAETPAIHIEPTTANHSTTSLSSISGTSLPTVREQGDKSVEEQDNELGPIQFSESQSYETDNKNETEKVVNEDGGKSVEPEREDGDVTQPTLSRSVDGISNQELSQNYDESADSNRVGMSQMSWSQQIEPNTVTEEGELDQSQQTEIERKNRSCWQNLVTPHLAPRDDPIVPSSGLSCSQQDIQSKPRVKRRPPGRKGDKIKDAAINGPHLPSSLVKSIFQHFSKAKVSRQALQFVEQGSQLFFKQLASDLMAYCHHAGRSTIETADVELLIKRQGFITDKQNLFSLIEKYLPMEYRQEIIPTVKSGNEFLLK